MTWSNIIEAYIFAQLQRQKEYIVHTTPTPTIHTNIAKTNEYAPNVLSGWGDRGMGWRNLSEICQAILPLKWLDLEARTLWILIEIFWWYCTKLSWLSGHNGLDYHSYAFEDKLTLMAHFCMQYCAILLLLYIFETTVHVPQIKLIGGLQGIYLCWSFLIFTVFWYNIVQNWWYKDRQYLTVGLVGHFSDSKSWAALRVCNRGRVCGD